MNNVNLDGINLDNEFDDALEFLINSNVKFQSNNKTRLNFGVYYTPKN